MRSVQSAECNGCGGTVVWFSDAAPCVVGRGKCDHIWHGYDGDAGWCLDCGGIHTVSADEDGAMLRFDGQFKDVRQPRCDGGCGVLADYQGGPCSWGCKHGKAQAVGP